MDQAALAVSVVRGTSLWLFIISFMGFVQVLGSKIKRALNKWKKS